MMNFEHLSTAYLASGCDLTLPSTPPASSGHDGFVRMNPTESLRASYENKLRETPGALGSARAVGAGTVLCSSLVPYHVFPAPARWVVSYTVPGF